jgi:hypothetical protein
LPDTPLDELLAGIGWPPEVVGAAISQEIVMLPPAAEADLDARGAAASEPAASESDVIARAAEHPQRREARLVVGVLRDGDTAAVLRLRASTAVGESAEDEELLVGADLAPNLAEALRQTLAE